MIENNKDTKIQTESQSMSESNKPWYKKRSTIIAASSILGAGVMATVIAVPIAVTSNTTNPINEAVNVLNATDNKASRITLWNDYITTLNNDPSATFKTARTIMNPNSPYAKIVYTPAFVTEFINFLIDNLYVSDETIIPTGSVTTANATFFKETLLAKRNFFEAPEAPKYTKYDSLFSFAEPPAGAMFTFVDHVTPTSQAIMIELFMPTSGLDLTYNKDKTVSFTIPKTHLATANENVRLAITKFPTTPAITSVTNYYFKPDSTIKLPSAVMTNFAKFLDNSVATEARERAKFQKNYNDIKTNVDLTPTSGLSYWNSYALNFAASNLSFLKAEIAKTIDTSGLYTFIKEVVPALDSTVLEELKKEISNDSTSELDTTPFVQSPSYNNNLLFDTQNQTGNKYSLLLNFTDFTYDFTVDNLFSGASAIKITPKLTLSGTLIQTPTSGPAVKFDIASKTFDFSKLINMSNVKTPATGGLIGFLDEISVETTELAKTTKGLAAFNNKTSANQMTEWNNFIATKGTNNLILDELKKPGVLYNFIQKNVDWTNLFGHGSTFPTINHTEFEKSLDAIAKNLTAANLSFVSSDATTKTAAVILQGVQWDSTATNVFTNISIYFGYEIDSISNINLTSGANMSLSQKNGISTPVSSKAEVVAAAEKRLSIVFETSASTHVAYFGQKKLPTDDSQVLTPIIIPNTILTPTTKFINFIQTQK